MSNYTAEDYRKAADVLESEVGGVQHVYGLRAKAEIAEKAKLGEEVEEMAIALYYALCKHKSIANPLLWGELATERRNSHRSQARTILTIVEYLSDPRDAVKLVALLLRLEARRSANDA